MKINASEQVEMSVSLKYMVSRDLSDYDEQQQFILTIHTDIVGCDYIGGGKCCRLGALKMYLVQVGNATNAKADLPAIFDMAQDTLNIGEVLFNSSFDDFCPWIKRRYEDSLLPWANMLILDRLTLVPEARGQQLGLVILRQAMADWSGGCSLVAMKPFPLQYGGLDKENVNALKLDCIKSDEKESTRRLRSYYAKLGFERVGRSGIFVLTPDDCRAIKMPDGFFAPRELFSQPALALE